MHHVLLLVQLAGAMAVVFGAVCLYVLACDPKTRIVHGLEHATIRILEAGGVPVPTAQSERGGFELDIPGDFAVRDEEVAAAAAEAIARVRAGEARLAYDPECGTVHGCRFVLPPLAAGAVAAVADLLGLPDPLALVLAVALAVAVYLAHRSIGLFLQRVATVSTKFAAASVTDVESRPHRGGLRITVGLRIFRDPRSLAS